MKKAVLDSLSLPSSLHADENDEEVAITWGTRSTSVQLGRWDS
jgi:hypothetical protein